MKPLLVGSSSSEEKDSEEEDSDGDSSSGPPALQSSSGGESDAGARSDRGCLYIEFVQAREQQGGFSMSTEYWRAKKDSTSAVFLTYYLHSVLRGRPVPCAGKSLFLTGLPLGFPEFVCWVGQMDASILKKFSGSAVADMPAGFLEYAREAAGQNARAASGELKGKSDRNWMPPNTAPSQADLKDRKKNAAHEKDRLASEQVEKLSGRAGGEGAARPHKDRRRKGKSKDAAGESKKEGKGGSGSDGGSGGGGGGGRRKGSRDRSSGAVTRSLRRNLQSSVLRRLETTKATMALEEQMSLSLEALEKLIATERKRYEEDLAVERAALRSAEAAAAAAMAAAAAATATAEARALAGTGSSGGGGGGGGEKPPVKEVLARAEALKKRANLVLADTRYPEAVEQYTLGIKVLEVYAKPAPGSKRSRDKRSDFDGEEEKGAGCGGGADKEEDKDTVVARELLLILLCNRSLAHLKWGNLGSAKQDAQHAMDIDPHHIKAYFRRAAAHKEAERYREALSDLRYILRLEPPPKKGGSVSDDILAVQKMARECEQKARAKGFKKALEETTKGGKPAMTASEQKEARDKWDATRLKGKKKSRSSAAPGASSAFPRPPSKGKGAAAAAATSGGAIAAAWERGESFLPARSKIRSLKEQAASVAAACIDRAPDAYVQWCEGLLSEYLIFVFERLSWVSLQTMLASGLYDEVGAISSNAQTDNWQAQDRYYRRLYASVTHKSFLKALSSTASGAAGKTPGVKRTGTSGLLSPLVLDPHLGLVDVLENHTLFTYQAWDAEEEASPKLFDFNSNRSSGRAVVSREEFVQQFNVFTEGQLALIDWNNVVAAGGSVLAAVHPPPPGPLRDFYHTLAYRSSDVDLFLYGLDEKAATEKVKQIYAAVKLANPKIEAVRSFRTITFFSEFPLRKVQIVLRLYKTLAEVLHGFDVDACSIGFDGETVWATNRAARAICKRYNVVDLTRRSPSYESRLFKYGKRGHAVLVRGLKMDKVRPNLAGPRVYQGSASSERGLAKLIALDACYRRFHLSKWGEYFSRWNEGLLHTSAETVTESQRIHNQESTLESDYTTMFIPYGPTWSRERTRRHVANYVHSANSWYYRMGLCDPAQAEIQPVVCGSIDFVLTTGVNTGEEDRMAYSHEEQTSLMHMKHVTGDEMWLTVNPGVQGRLLSGSFHPMSSSKEDWERGVYV